MKEHLAAGIRQKEWTFVGSLGSGERVYACRDDGDLAIEKDHSFLDEPTPEERTQILETMSHIRALVTEKTEESHEKTHTPLGEEGREKAASNRYPSTGTLCRRLPG